MGCESDMDCCGKAVLLCHVETFAEFHTVEIQAYDAMVHQD